MTKNYTEKYTNYTNTSAMLENSVVATGLKKVSFHSNPK